VRPQRHGDDAGKGRFALLTGISGQAWADAAVKVSAATGVEITGYVIGPGRPYTDLYEDWARLREVGEDGCVLVRPDGHVAWRAPGPVDASADTLAEVVRKVLSV
jgi:2,4-dichlorophenol 6-monooxygenase